MNVLCPRCMKEETVTVDVNDGDTLRCNGCDEEFTVGDVRAVVESWGRLLPWLEAHPARTAEPAAT